MAQFVSKLSEAEHEEILTLAAFGQSPAAIVSALGGKIGLRQVQRLVKAGAEDIDFRRRKFERQREQREQHVRSPGEEPLKMEPHVVPGGVKPEPRYASKLGPNARERHGLSAMPPEIEDTGRWLEAQGRTLYRVGGVTIGEDASSSLFGPSPPRPPYTNEQFLAGEPARRG